ncbi:MAG: hypothetical protein IJU68_05555 [Bacteroidales bacterium]|nr:hypothetical protein [Bacteroidales bacterium]
MKKFACLSAVLLLAACSVSELGDDTVDIRLNDVYTAGFENPKSKVYVDKGLNTHWTAGDEISIFTSTYNEEYKFEGNTGDTEGTFAKVSQEEHSGSDIPATYAAYPYRADTYCSTYGHFTLTLPDVQLYAANSYGLGANTMLAVANNNFLPFKNLCGYIVLRLYGEGSVKSIILSGNSGEQISGRSTAFFTDGVPYVMALPDAKKTITLDCGEGVELGKTAEQATEFWFVVPPMTFSQGLSFKVINTDLWSMEKTTSTSRTVSRSVRNAFAPVEVSFTIPPGDNVAFEDQNFKAYCVENFDTNKDGEISVAEAEAVETITVCTDDIESLSGIEHFVNLKNLWCYGSSSSEWSVDTGCNSTGMLTELDLSQNKALKSLSCEKNRLTELDISANTALTSLTCYSNNLIRLDVSENTSLTSLLCQENRLYSIGVGANAALKTLWCGSNLMSVLDVSQNKELKQLSCDGNPLTGLDVSKNTALTNLSCFGCGLTAIDVNNNKQLVSLTVSHNKLTALDVSQNTALTTLGCPGNQLSALDVSNNVVLQNLYCGYNALSMLDVSGHTALKELYCNYNKLTELNVEGCTNLLCLRCDDNLLTSLDVSGNTALAFLYCGNNPNLLAIWLQWGQEIGTLQYDSNTATIKYKGIVNFNDANFKAYCLENFDANGDGVVSYAEAESVTTIKCYKKEISSLEGLQYFTSLDTLWCSENSIASLDVSHNTALSNLSCGWNQLSSLDLSNNTQLTTLRCQSNNLSTLDVSNNAALVEFSCNGNQLTSIDISNNTALNFFACSYNGITSLDVSKNAELEYLESDENQLTSLDLSNNLKLRALWCNTNKLTSLNVSANTELRSLFCDSNQLKSLDVSNNAALNTLQCRSNRLTTLDVSKNLALGTLSCSSNQYLSEIWLSLGQTIRTLSYDSVYATLKYKMLFKDANFRAYCIQYFDADGDGEISDKEAKAVTKVDCSDKGIASLENIQYFTGLTKLSCERNQLTSLDVSKNTELIELTCERNQLATLTIGPHSKLEAVSCSYNQLTALDLTGNSALVSLSCANNSLSALDLRSCTALQFLHCPDNHITSLDVSKNTKLTRIAASSNLLQALDISNNTALVDLICDYNQLQALDISKNTALSYLSVRLNALSSLDISQNKGLTYLECSNNALSALDVSKNTALIHLYCESNQIPSLDVSNMSALRYIRCTNNKIASLDVHNSVGLKELWCRRNLLTTLDVSANMSLTTLSCNNNPGLTEIWLTIGQQINSLSYDTDVATIKYRYDRQIQVTDGSHTVVFGLNNTPVAQSLYNQLPLTVDVSNYGSNEKIFYPGTPLSTDGGIEGVCPAGTLAYFSPWGNVVMYYGPANKYTGLYIIGLATEGAEQIQNLSGQITVTKL